MKYDLDLSKIDIRKYKDFLKNQYLIPSRKILHQKIDENFNNLNKYGIVNLLDLKQAVSTKDKIIKLSNGTGISQDYLNILRREIGTFDIKGIYLKDFPTIDSDIISKLDKSRIKTTKNFYEYYYTLNNEEKLSAELNISKEMIKYLIALSSLARINGIAALAAITFYEAGYKNLHDILNSTKEEMLEKITNINDAKKYYKAKLGLKDMQFIIDYVTIITSFDNE